MQIASSYVATTSVKRIVVITKEDYTIYNGCHRGFVLVTLNVLKRPVKDRPLLLFH